MLDAITQQNQYYEAIKRTFRRIAGRIFPKAFFKWSQSAQRSHASWFIGDPTYVLTFEIDRREEIEALPRVLDILARYGILAGFSCSGELIDRYPELFKRAVSEGHELINRAYFLEGEGRAHRSADKAALIDEIGRCHRACEGAIGYRMVGFRMPHLCLPDGEIYAFLRKLNYSYSSSTFAVNTRAWGLPYPESCGILEVPISPTAGGASCAPNASFFFKNQRGRQPDAFKENFVETIDLIARLGSFATHRFYPSDVVEGEEIEFMCASLADKRARNGLRLTTYRDFLDCIWKECYLF